MAIYNEFGYITIDETCNAYFKWKDLNTYISNNSHRGINMPDAISEPISMFLQDARAEHIVIAVKIKKKSYGNVKSQWYFSMGMN